MRLKHVAIHRSVRASRCGTVRKLSTMVKKISQNPLSLKGGLLRNHETRRRKKACEACRSVRRNVENEACGYRVDNRVDNFAARGGLTISVRRRALKLDDDDAATTTQTTTRRRRRTQPRRGETLEAGQQTTEDRGGQQKTTPRQPALKLYCLDFVGEHADGAKDKTDFLEIQSDETKTTNDVRTRRASLNTFSLTPRRRRVAARGCCDAPVMRLCAAPRCRVVVVAPSSLRRAWQHLAGNIWRGLAGNIWLATFGWQHLAGNIWRGLAGNIWLATFGCVFARRRRVVLSSPSSWVSQGEARVRVRPGELQRLGTWEAERFWASVSAAATAWGLQRL